MNNQQEQNARKLPYKLHLSLPVIALLVLAVIISTSSFQQKKTHSNDRTYQELYHKRIDKIEDELKSLISLIHETSNFNELGREAIRKKINTVRLSVKAADIWLRYLEPTAYLHINGTLPVEWETEAFEKYEPPYKRTGAGLFLLLEYLQEPTVSIDSMIGFINPSIKALEIYRADSIVTHTEKPGSFLFANRLHLLNCAAIYSTGFECNDTLRVIPELGSMMEANFENYQAYNRSFPNMKLNNNYLETYQAAILFVKNSRLQSSQFDHFIFIRDFIVPLFKFNQEMIKTMGFTPDLLTDYSLNDDISFLFDKKLFSGQQPRGIYAAVTNESEIKLISDLGKMLFFDPILSGNNKRSCASCHKPDQLFTDTSLQTAFQFNPSMHLPRNTPSLVNVMQQQLLMADGKHISLLAQAKDVTQNPIEMGGTEKDIIEKISTCTDYEKAFNRLIKRTPAYPKLSMNHIVSCIITYYSSFSYARADFDKMMQKEVQTDPEVQKGFNVFMGKAQCGTCHFVPQFNGVKPPFLNSEFEVIGVPEDNQFKKLSRDSGRYLINPSNETLFSFRTATLRNIEKTSPYMHNGVFKTLDDVIDFYDAGGGKGKGLRIENQTLSADSLKLTVVEKKQLICFLKSLKEDLPHEIPPLTVPSSRKKELNSRKVGGEY